MSKPKSSAPATTKALQAWQSELRRLEKRLEEWANALAQREETLEQQETALANAINEAESGVVQRYADNLSDDSGTMVDDDEDFDGDCGCTADDAKAGCDCPKCEEMKKVSAKLKGTSQYIGDEVQWLENLWKLKDKRN
jgi:hypothetical protein